MEGATPVPVKILPVGRTMTVSLGDLAAARAHGDRPANEARTSTSATTPEVLSAKLW
jgi:hypothetical protein